MTSPVALVLAAGKGTRMKSDRPKVLFEVLGRSLVQRVVDAARGAGAEDVVVVVGYRKELVQQALSGVSFAVQEAMRGTGDAVAAARGALDFRGRPVVILPGDVPMMTADTIALLLREHEARGAALTVGTMRPPDATGYGRIVRDASGAVTGIVEHRDCSPEQLAIDEVNTGLYVVDGTLLFGEDGRSGALARLDTDNDQSEYYLTDVVSIASRDGLPVSGVLIPDPTEVAGVNDRAQLAELEEELRDRINVAAMRAGVTMEDPDDVRIEEGVVLARDVTLGAAVELRGRTRVEEGASIARGCVLTDVIVGEGASVAPYVVATNCRIGPGAKVLPFTVINGINEKKPDQTVEADHVSVGVGARVGPFSHLRQSASLAADVHVGNFVELKKTEMHEGSKANHLAYLGDAEIGPRSNIGAGVITCNYDGFAKHRTIVGTEVFVGTDSHLVAPVRLGDGSYVATGTTVTKDVPADALAIGRARQENKPNRASKLRDLLRAKAQRGKG